MLDKVQNEHALKTNTITKPLISTPLNICLLMQIYKQNFQKQIFSRFLIVFFSKMSLYFNFDNINIVYEGIFLTWAIIGVIMFSVGTFTLFLNYFPVIRYNNIYSFLSFFLVPMLLILLCGSVILCLWTVKIPFIVCLSGAYLLFRNKIKNTADSAG